MIKNELKQIVELKRIAIHILYWIGTFLVMTILLSRLDPPIEYLKFTISLFVPLVLPTYINFYLLDKLVKEQKYTAYVLSVLFLIIGFGYFSVYFHEKIMNTPQALLSGVMVVLVVILITTGLKYIKESRRQMLILKEARNKQNEAELTLLKWQFSPHFLFNVLNNFYGMAKSNNDEQTAAGIMKLSGMMRYLINEATSDKVMLEKEIGQINDFIYLQKLRFSNEDDINIEFTTSNCRNALVSPMLFMPFVENAFKHGISLQKHSYIKMDMKVENSILFFEVRNSIFKNNTDISGLGLANVKRRLELLYPDRHNLVIIEESEDFSARLRIELDK